MATEYAQQDQANIERFIDQLKQNYRGEQNQNLGYTAVLTQPFQAPNYSVAAHDMLRLCGFEVETRYSVGGEEPNTMLWATSRASPEHVGKVRSLAIAEWGHPIYRIVNSASFNEFHFRVGKCGAIIYDNEEVTHTTANEIVPSAFLLSHLVARIRGYRLHPNEIELYEELRKNEHRPLGFEEIGGLALQVMQDTIEANQELAL